MVERSIPIPQEQALGRTHTQEIEKWSANVVADLLTIAPGTAAIILSMAERNPLLGGAGVILIGVAFKLNEKIYEKSTSYKKPTSV